MEFLPHEQMINMARIPESGHTTYATVVLRDDIGKTGRCNSLRQSLWCDRIEIRFELRIHRFVFNVTREALYQQTDSRGI